jgi:hypothetical protein
MDFNIRQYFSGDDYDEEAVESYVRTRGKDERLSVCAFHDGTEYLYRLMKALAGSDQAGAVRK